MLVELLILFALLKEKSSIYGLKKKIDEHFAIFYSPSLGSIHPALKKLHKNNYVNLKSSTSPGGQKRSEYSITPGGKKYFENLMLNTEMTEQTIKIKLLILPEMEKSLQVNIINNIMDFYREKLIDFENYYEKNSKTYIKHVIEGVKKEIDWLNQQ